MDVIHFPDDARPPRWAHPVLALGNFDGLHRGHRKILERLRRVAGERGATSVVMTFDPHPPRVVRPDKAPPLIMTTAQKLEALEEAGVQGAAIVRFTHELSQWDPETFVRNVLVDWLRVSEVWVGANFLFGHDRTGNFSMLRSLGARYGFEAVGQGETGLETTTGEMLAILNRVRPPVAELPRIKDFLDDCDLVKFARFSPTEELCRVALDRGETIVRRTIPVMQLPSPPPGSTGGPPSSQHVAEGSS